MHIASQVLIVEYAKPAELGCFLPIRANDSRAGEILLSVRRHSTEMVLDRFESLVDDPPEPYHENGEEGHRDQRNAGEHWTITQHESQREHAAGDRRDQVHDGGSRRHPDRAQVVGEPRHDIAGAGAAEISRVEGLEMLKEIIPQVILDPATDAVEQLAHLVAQPAAEQGDGDHDARDGPDGLATRPATHVVDRQLDELWDHARHGGRADGKEESEDDLRSIPPQVWQEWPESPHTNVGPMRRRYPMNTKYNILAVL